MQRNQQVKVSLEPLNATTKRHRKTHGGKVILVSQVQLARCIHKKDFQGKTMAGHMGQSITGPEIKWHMLIKTNLIGG